MIDTQSTLVQRTLTRDMPSGRRVVAMLEMRRAKEGERLSPGGLSPAFSLTGEVYNARSNARGAARQKAGREPDTSGAIHAEIIQALPRLKQFAAMHLSNPETGEPMHAESNGWYWYAGSRDDLRDVVTRSGGYTGFDGIYAHQLESRHLPDTEDGRRRYCYMVACELLRVSNIPDMPALDEIDDVEAMKEIAILRDQSRETSTGVDVRDYAAVIEAKRAAAAIDREANGIERALIVESFARARAVFSAFIDDQRDRWKQEAAEARDFIQALPEEES